MMHGPINIRFTRTECPYGDGVSVRRKEKLPSIPSRSKEVFFLHNNHPGLQPTFSLTQWLLVALFLRLRRAGAKPSPPHGSEVRIALCLFLLQPIECWRMSRVKFSLNKYNDYFSWIQIISFTIIFISGHKLILL